MYRTDLWDSDGRYGVVFAASGTDHGYVFQGQCNDPGRAAALRIISLGFVVSGISVVASGALEALGEGIPSFIISLLRYLVLIVPAASIGSRMFGITGVWASFPVAEVLTAVAAA